MELSTSEYRRFAEETRQLAKSAKTVEERDFLAGKGSELGEACTRGGKEEGQDGPQK